MYYKLSLDLWGSYMPSIELYIPNIYSDLGRPMILTEITLITNLKLNSQKYLTQNSHVHTPPNFCFPNCRQNCYLIGWLYQGQIILDWELLQECKTDISDDKKFRKYTVFIFTNSLSVQPCSVGDMSQTKVSVYIFGDTCVNCLFRLTRSGGVVTKL